MDQVSHVPLEKQVQVPVSQTVQKPVDVPSQEQHQQQSIVELLREVYSIGALSPQEVEQQVAECLAYSARYTSQKAASCQQSASEGDKGAGDNGAGGQLA